MYANQHRLSWLCDNIEQHLTRIDRVLDEIVSEPLGESTVAAGEPWVERLFEKRRGLQSTLAEIELQIGRSLT